MQNAFMIVLKPNTNTLHTQQPSQIISTTESGHLKTFETIGKTYIEYYEDIFVGTVCRVVDDEAPERWYLCHPETQAWVEVDPDQLWFWTKQWQAAERQADDDLRKGSYTDYEDFDDFIDSL